MKDSYSIAKGVYLCSFGHELDQPARCPQDGTLAEAAYFVCKYCDYNTQLSKNRMCPNCDAEMEVCAGEICKTHGSDDLAGRRAA